ncbi:MAG: hypothetical protein AB7V46_07690 [Thermomicrobiales bacterium]
MTTQQAKAAAASNSPGQATNNGGENLAKALELAHKGDAAGIKQVRKFLDDHPKARRMLGNVVSHVQARLVSELSCGDLVAGEAINCQLDEMRSDLSGSNPTQSEKMLIDRILTLWLQVSWLDMKVMDLPSNNPRVGDQQIKLHQQASQQYNKAIRELAILRRLSPEYGLPTTKTVLEVPSTAASPVDGPTLAVVDDHPEDHGSESAAVPQPATQASPTPVRESLIRASRPETPKPRAASVSPSTVQDDEDAPVYGILLTKPLPKWMTECELEEA